MKKGLLSLGGLFGISALVFAIVTFASWAMPEPSGSGIGTRTFLVQNVADTVISSVTTVPTELTTPIAANQKLHIRYYLPFTLEGGSSGIKFAVNAPAAPSSYAQTITYVINADSVRYSDTRLSESAYSLPSAAGSYTGLGAAIVDVTVINGSNAGNVVLEMGQRSSQATNCILHVGAYAEVTKW